MDILYIGKKNGQKKKHHNSAQNLKTVLIHSNVSKLVFVILTVFPRYLSLLCKINRANIRRYF